MLSTVIQLILAAYYNNQSSSLYIFIEIVQENFDLSAFLILLKLIS